MNLENISNVHNNKFFNYNFLVYIKRHKIGFSRVQNIQDSCQIEEIAVGGQNYSPHIAISPSNKGGRLILERGILWEDKSFVKNWKSGYYINGPIDIIAVRKDMFRLRKTFSISGGIIEKFELSDLDALDSKVVIEKFEIVHNGILKL